MVKVLVILMMFLLAAPAMANVMCGIPPIPPIGCHYICICDNNGMNCRWVAVCG